jgi:hypothetical protein
MLGAPCYSPPRPCRLSSRFSYVWGLVAPSQTFAFRRQNAVIVLHRSLSDISTRRIGRVAAQRRFLRGMNAGDDWFLVTLPPGRDLLFSVKHLFVRATGATACRGSRMSDEAFSAPKS